MYANSSKWVVVVAAAHRLDLVLHKNSLPPSTRLVKKPKVEGTTERKKVAVA